MNNVLTGWENIKLCHQQDLWKIENNRDYAAHPKNAVNFLVA
jgi:hypothetical protein